MPIYFIENYTLFEIFSDKNTIALYLTRKELDSHFHSCIHSAAVSFFHFFLLEDYQKKARNNLEKMRSIFIAFFR